MMPLLSLPLHQPPLPAADAEAEENNLRTLEEFHNKEFVEKLVKA
jgi:hypothetical protein